MNDPEVSIVIPVFNSGKNITKSLNSLSEQSFKSFEVIIINDGSTDNSSFIIETSIKENPSILFKYIEHTENIGECETRNIGIALARGKYISLMDADDRYHPEFIASMYKTISQGYDLVYCGFDIYDEEIGKLIRYETRHNYSIHSKQIINGYLFSTLHFSHASAMYRKEFLKKHKICYSEGCAFGSDVEFVCKIMIKNPKCTSVPLSLYTYIRNPDSVSNTLTSKKIQHCIRALSRVQRLMPSIKDRLRFEITRKASMGYHLIEELYVQQKKVKIPIIEKLYFCFLFFSYILRRPKKRLKYLKVSVLRFFLSSPSL